MNVATLWWAVGFMKGARAVAIGHVIFLSKKIEDNDFEHELIHVQQYNRAPFIFPFLYYFELVKKGYRNNKYEEEAYQTAGNIYKEKYDQKK